MRLTDHLRQVLIQQGFTLKIELDGMRGLLYLAQYALPDGMGHEPFPFLLSPFISSLPDGAFRTFQLTHTRGFDGDE